MAGIALVNSIQEPDIVVVREQTLGAAGHTIPCRTLSNQDLLTIEGHQILVNCSISFACCGYSLAS
jgi:hypothetical protein